MKLSQAIRIGAALVPQTRYRYFDFGLMKPDGSHDVVGACMLGMAYLAIKHEEEEVVSAGYLGVTDALHRTFPALNDGVNHPVTQRYFRLGAALASANDAYHWDWLQGVEWLESLGL